MAQKVLMKGNEALAEAAIQAGCRHFFGYPITPQTEVAAYMAKRMPKIGGTYLQAESELAAINMVQGAAAAGVRAMTSSSSPGISLKSEAISYMCGSDLPGLIINVQRGGPGLGGIQPSQSDYWQATKAPGHGDLHVLVFAPNSVQEMVDLVSRAFDKADEYRMPAMILADGMLGQMMEPVEMEISDARMNLRDSIAYALDDASSGVSLVFGGKIIAGTRAKKVKTMSYNAFASINYPELAVMRDEHLVRYIEPKPFTEPVSFCHELNPRVFLLKLTPGMSPVILKDIFSQYDGIIVESFGVGGIPDSLLHEFVRLMEEYGSSKAVVMTTQVTYEGSNIGVYEVGKRVQEQFPLLEAYDMNLEAVLTKLMWILGQRPGSFEAVRELFYKTVNYDIYR